MEKQQIVIIPGLISAFFLQIWRQIARKAWNDFTHHVATVMPPGSFGSYSSFVSANFFRTGTCGVIVTYYITCEILTEVSQSKRCELKWKAWGLLLNIPLTSWTEYPWRVNTKSIHSLNSHIAKLLKLLCCCSP